MYDGDDDISSHPDNKPKQKGAYYKNIERKMHLKKKRANVSIAIQTFFHNLNQNRHTTNMRTNGRSFAHYMHQWVRRKKKRDRRP